MDFIYKFKNEKEKEEFYKWLYLILPFYFSVFRYSFWFIFKFIPGLFYKLKKNEKESKLNPLDMTLIIPTIDTNKKIFMSCFKTWKKSNANIIIVADKKVIYDIGIWLKDLITVYINKNDIKYQQKHKII